MSIAVSLFVNSDIPDWAVTLQHWQQEGWALSKPRGIRGRSLPSCCTSPFQIWKDWKSQKKKALMQKGAKERTSADCHRPSHQWLWSEPTKCCLNSITKKKSNLILAGPSHHNVHRKVEPSRILRHLDFAGFKLRRKMIFQRVLIWIQGAPLPESFPPSQTWERRSPHWLRLPRSCWGKQREMLKWNSTFYGIIWELSSNGRLISPCLDCVNSGFDLLVSIALLTMDIILCILWREIKWQICR